MSNSSVSFASYAACVAQQVAFLVELDGYVQVREVTHADVRECYERNVSVDGCANSLVR